MTTPKSLIAAGIYNPKDLVNRFIAAGKMKRGETKIDYIKLEMQEQNRQAKRRQSLKKKISAPVNVSSEIERQRSGTTSGATRPGVE